MQVEITILSEVSQIEKDQILYDIHLYVEFKT